MSDSVEIRFTLKISNLVMEAKNERFSRKFREKYCKNYH